MGDAIGYIKELKTILAELKVLVERKRPAREGPRMDEKGGSLWLHKKSELRRRSTLESEDLLSSFLI